MGWETADRRRQDQIKTDTGYKGRLSWANSWYELVWNFQLSHNWHLYSLFTHPEVSKTTFTLIASITRFYSPDVTVQSLTCQGGDPIINTETTHWRKGTMCDRQHTPCKTVINMININNVRLDWAVVSSIVPPKDTHTFVLQSVVFSLKS